MTDYNLPSKGSPENYRKVLEDFVRRYERDEAPVHYKRAALSVNEYLASSILVYLSNIGVIQTESQGEYTPTDAVIDFVKDEEDGVGAITSIIQENDEIFREARFVAETTEWEELSEVADTVQDQLEISEGDGKKVDRATRIFSEFGVLQADPTKSTNTINESSNTESTTNTTSIDDFVSMTPEEYETIPARTNPEQLYQVCSFLSQGGTRSMEEITEETGMTERNASSSLRYGEILELIEENEDGDYSATPTGYEFGMADKGGREYEEVLRNQILEYELYTDLLLSVQTYEESHESNQIDRNTLYKILRTDFGYTKESEDSLSRKISTFLRTLSEAGFGEFKQAGGGYPTRITGINESRLFEEIKEYSHEDQATDETQVADITNSDTEEGQELSYSGESEEKPQKIERTIDQVAEKQTKAESGSLSPDLNGSVAQKRLTFDIQVEINLAEISEDELKVKLEHINSLFSDDE